jgi:DNA mismatch repair protein MutH
MAVNSPNMSPAQQAQLAAQAAAMQLQQNRQFMALGIRKKALAQQANGGANNQAFVAGQPLTYNIPTANNGYLVGFWVNCL